HLFQLSLRKFRMSWVSIRRLHLPQVNLSHLQHRLAGELVIREELNPVAVFDLRLRQPLRPTLQIVRVGDRELGVLNQRAVGVGVDYRVKQYPAFFVIALTNGLNSLAIEFSIATWSLRLFKRYFILWFTAARRNRQRDSQNKKKNLCCFHVNWAGHALPRG